MGLMDIIKKIFSFIFGDNKDEITRDLIRGYVNNDYTSENAEQAAADDLKKVKKEERKKIRAVIDLMTKSTEIANINESLMKLYLKVLYYAYWDGLEQLISDEKKTDEINTAFLDKIESLDKKHFGKFKKKMLELKEEFNKLEGVTEKAEDAGDSKKESKNVKKKDKLRKKIKKNVLELTKDMAVLIHDKSSVYRDQIDGLKNLLKNSEVVNQNTIIQNRVKDTLDKKEHSFNFVVEQDKKMKGSDKIDDVLNKVHDFIVPFSQEIKSEISASVDSNEVVAIFMSKREFVRRIPKVYLYLKREQRNWFRNYMDYLTAVLKRTGQLDIEVTENISEVIKEENQKQEQKQSQELEQTLTEEEKKKKEQQEKLKNDFMKSLKENVEKLNKTNKTAKEVKNLGTRSGIKEPPSGPKSIKAVKVEEGID